MPPAPQPAPEAATGPPGIIRLLFDHKVTRDVSSLSEEAMALQPQLLAQKTQVSMRISETIRMVAFGSLASCYALLIANKDLAPVFAGTKPILLMSAALGIGAIIVDALQYLLGYINVQQALGSTDQDYPENWARLGRSYCFVVKQFLAYAAALLLLAAVTSILL
jgi:hypothetical protein